MKKSHAIYGLHEKSTFFPKNLFFKKKKIINLEVMHFEVKPVHNMICL